MSKFLFDLSPFIDPVTGFIPLKKGLILEGDIDDIGKPSGTLIEIKQAIEDSKKLTRNSIWRGGEDGIRVESDALTIAESDIVKLKTDFEDSKKLTHNSIWRGDEDGIRVESDALTVTIASLSTISATLTALEVNLRSQDLILKTPSVFFPNAIALSKLDTGILSVGILGALHTIKNLNIGQMPALAHDRIFIGNRNGEVVTKSINDFRFLPELKNEEIVIGSLRGAVAKLPRDFTTLTRIEEANIITTTFHGFRKSNIKVKGDGSIAVTSLKLDDPNDLASGTLEHKAAQYISRNTTYTWPSFGDNGQVLHVKDRGTLYWDSVLSAKLDEGYIIVGNTRGVAEKIDPGALPLGEGYLVNARDGFGVGRLQRSDILVSPKGDMAVLSLRLRNNYGGYIDHVSSQWSGTGTKYIWPSAEESKFLKSTNRQGLLAWVDLTSQDINLKNEYIIEGSRQGKGIEKLPADFPYTRHWNNKIVVVEPRSGFRLINLSLPTEIGTKGQVLKKGTSTNLEWGLTVENLPLILKEYVAGFSNAEILSRLGIGILKLQYGGRLAIAKENTDYPSVTTVRKIEGDIRKIEGDIRQQSVSIQRNSTSITSQKAELSALNARTVNLTTQLVSLRAQVSINTSQIVGLWLALAISSIIGGISGGGATESWVINYVRQKLDSLTGSDSINIVFDNDKYIFSINDSYINKLNQIRFFPKDTSISSFQIGENVVILN